MAGENDALVIKACNTSNFPKKFCGFGPPSDALDGSCWGLYIDKTNKCIYVWDGTKWCKPEGEEIEFPTLEPGDIPTVECDVYAGCDEAVGEVNEDNGYTFDSGLDILPGDKLRVYAPGRIWEDSDMMIHFLPPTGSTYVIEVVGHVEPCVIRIEVTRTKTVQVVGTSEPNV